MGNSRTAAAKDRPPKSGEWRKKHFPHLTGSGENRTIKLPDIYILEKALGRKQEKECAEYHGQAHKRKMRG